MTAEMVIVRFMPKFVVLESGCWLWVASCSPSGYGHFRVDGKTVRAHRFAYEYWHGPIPADKELDHCCRVRACVNPAHLEAVSHQENVLRGEARAAANARKAVCPKCGGAFTTTNRGSRRCRPCGNAAAYAWRKANPERRKEQQRRAYLVRKAAR